MMNAFKKMIFGGICLVAIGCYYDSQEILYNNVTPKPCDTTNITYAGKVAKIINDNCSACHSASTGLQSGIYLDTYEGLREQALNGKLMGDITQSPNFNPMPESGNMLDPCSIAIIQHWVEMNTPNN